MFDPSDFVADRFPDLQQFDKIEFLFIISNTEEVNYLSHEHCDSLKWKIKSSICVDF